MSLGDIVAKGIGAGTLALGLSGCGALLGVAAYGVAGQAGTAAAKEAADVIMAAGASFDRNNAIRDSGTKVNVNVGSAGNPEAYQNGNQGAFFGAFIDGHNGGARDGVAQGCEVVSLPQPINLAKYGLGFIFESTDSYTPVNITLESSASDTLNCVVKPNTLYCATRNQRMAPENFLGSAVMDASFEFGDVVDFDLRVGQGQRVQETTFKAYYKD